MRLKIEAGWGIREISRAGYGMEISWRDRDTLVSIGGMRDNFEIDSGMRDLNSIRPFQIYLGGIGIKILKVAGWRDLAKLVAGCGI